MPYGCADVARETAELIITDDNFARNRNWEPIFDRLIELRAEGLLSDEELDTLIRTMPRRGKRESPRSSDRVPRMVTGTTGTPAPAAATKAPM